MRMFCILQEDTHANKVKSHSQHDVCGRKYSVWDSEDSDQVEPNLEQGRDFGVGNFGNVKCFRIKNK